MASVIPSNLAQTARRLLQSSAQSSNTGLYVTRRTFAAAGDKFNREKVSKKLLFFNIDFLIDNIQRITNILAPV